MAIDGVIAFYCHGGFLNIEFAPAIQFLALLRCEEQPSQGRVVAVALRQHRLLPQAYSGEAKDYGNPARST